jgi:hypothetical protein
MGKCNSNDVQVKFNTNRVVLKTLLSWLVFKNQLGSLCFSSFTKHQIVPKTSTYVLQNSAPKSSYTPRFWCRLLKKIANSVKQNYSSFRIEGFQKILWGVYDFNKWNFEPKPSSVLYHFVVVNDGWISHIVETHF